MCRVLSPFSCVRLFVPLWTIACQGPLSIGFYRQEYRSASPCPPSGHLSDPGTEPVSQSLALAGRFFTTTATWEAQSQNPVLFLLSAASATVSHLSYKETTIPCRTVANWCRFGQLIWLNKWMCWSQLLSALKSRLWAPFQLQVLKLVSRRIYPTEIGKHYKSSVSLSSMESWLVNIYQCTPAFE